MRPSIPRLNLQTVAEGIEHADLRAELINMGWGSGQGFLFAKPISAEVVSELLFGSAPNRVTSARVTVTSP